MGQAQQTSLQSENKCSNDRALRSTSLNVLKASAAGETKAVQLFFPPLGEEICLFPFPKPSHAPSPKNVTPIQHCRPLCSCSGPASNCTQNALLAWWTSCAAQTSVAVLRSQVKWNFSEWKESSKRMSAKSRVFPKRMRRMLWSKPASAPHRCVSRQLRPPEGLKGRTLTA